MDFSKNVEIYGASRNIWRRMVGFQCLVTEVWPSELSLSSCKIVNDHLLEASLK